MNRRPLAFLAGAVVTLACLLPGAARGDEAGDLVSRGRTLLGKRDYTAAATAFVSATGKDPGSIEARRGAAEALLGLGRPDEALEHANKGLELAKDRDAGLWLLLARAYMQRGDRLPAGQDDQMKAEYADAKAKASLALKQDPSLTLARAVLARACRLTEEIDRAEQAVREGLEKAPADFDLLMEKGHLAIKKKDYAGAVEAFSQACEADPRSGDAQFQKGVSQAWQRSFGAAADAFSRAAVLDPANRRALLNMTKYAGDRVIAMLRAVLKEKPDHAWAHAYLAYYLAAAKEKDEAGAQSEIRAALSLEPGDPDLIAWYGVVLDLLGKKDDARAAWRKALEKNPQTKTAWDRLSDYALNPASGAKMSDRKELIEALSKVGSSDGLFWNNVGLFYRDQARDPRRALDAYLKAADLLPEDQGVQNDTGLIYLFYGRAIGEDPKKAIPFFEGTLSLVDDRGQDPEMGFRDSLENLCRYYGDEDGLAVERNPEKALAFAERRNDPDLLRRMPAGVGVPSPHATRILQWAEKQLKK